MPHKGVLLLTLRTTTTLQVAIGTIRKSIVEVGLDVIIILGLGVGVTAESTAIAQGNVVGTSDSLVSPRHLEWPAWGVDGNRSSH